MANSLDQIFRNFINRITGGDTEENVAETKPDQGGLMAPRVVRPRARPEDVEPIGGVATGAASTGNIALKRFVDGLNEATKLDVSLRPKARPLQNTLIDPNLSADTLQQKHNMPLYKFQQENSVASDDGSTVKVFSAPTSDAAVDEIVMQAESLFEKITKPKARPKSIEEIQAIRASQEYTDLDTTRGLQAALNNAGITVDGKPLEEDGIMGLLTKKAIRAFQKDKNLKVDGIAGPLTKQALYSVRPQPKITEEKLQPSIYDKPAQVGPDQMQVGFSRDDADALSTDLRYQEYLRREEDKKQKGLMEKTPTSDNFKLTPEQQKRVKTAAVGGFAVNAFNVIPAHFKQFVGNLLGTSEDDIKTETFFKGSELDAMRSIIKANIIRTGDENILNTLLEKGDTSNIKLTPKQVEAKLKNLGFSGGDKKSIKSFQKKFGLEPDGVVGSLTTNKLLRMGAVEYKDYTKGLKDVGWVENIDPLSLFDKEGAVKKTLGQFNWRIDNNGNLLITDQYNFNNAKEMNERYPTTNDKIKYLSGRAAQVATGDYSLYGWLRDTGAFYGSKSGEGTKFEINLGKI
tara:strand:+ start:16 stop:1734 length:1719 start_codon:yes stop_codon:yes gene_type:complete